MTITLSELRRFAINRSLFEVKTIDQAIQRLGVVQADPIQAPARAHDQILRVRVRGYRAGDLSLQYQRLGLEEAFVQNYGYVQPSTLSLIHPRKASPWRVMGSHPGLDKTILKLLKRHGPMQPRQIEEHMGDATHAKTVRNGWGGTSSAVTRWLEAMHWHGQVRISHRVQGQKVFAHTTIPNPRERSVKAAAARGDALALMMLQLYAPLPQRSWTQLTNFATYYIADGRNAAKRVQHAITSGVAKTCKVDSTVWCWPAQESPLEHAELLPEHEGRVRIVAPFDPLTWDRLRFEQFWDWQYRFEAYTPQAKRLYGYYAHPVLWNDQVVGWANLSLESTTRQQAQLDAQVGFVHAPKRGPMLTAFKKALSDELDQYAQFIGAHRHRTVFV